MAQRSYHPLAKVAFTAAALLTLLTLTLHGHRTSGNEAKPNPPTGSHLRVETSEFPH